MIQEFTRILTAGAIGLLFHAHSVGATDEQTKSPNALAAESAAIVGAPAASEKGAEASTNLAHANALSQAFRAAAAKMLPSVVTVRVPVQAQRRDGGVIGVLEGEEHPRFQSLGSGVIISSDGLVMTNNHVIGDAKNVLVELSSGREFSTKDIRTDPKSDLAILRLDSSETFPAAEIGNSEDLMVGDWVLAIGSPFELSATVSAGIISRKGSNIADLLKGQFLQTDAAINPGNSGGPLVNLQGKVVGINTAISSQTGTFMGVGFAIPMNRAKWVRDELLAHGKVRRAVLGVKAGPIPQDIADKLEENLRGGAYVSVVTYGRPAQKAGVQVGDIILKLADQKVVSGFSLADVVEQCPVGQPLQLMLLRNGERVELMINLEAVE